MCALAPSQAVLIASSDGVPKRSVIKSNYRKHEIQMDTVSSWKQLFIRDEDQIWGNKPKVSSRLTSRSSYFHF